MAVWVEDVIVMTLQLGVHEGQLCRAATLYSAVASTTMSEGAERQRCDGLWWMGQGGGGEGRIEGRTWVEESIRQSKMHVCCCLKMSALHVGLIPHKHHKQKQPCLPLLVIFAWNQPNM